MAATHAPGYMSIAPSASTTPRHTSGPARAQARTARLRPQLGQPNDDTWGPGLDDQYTAELFYRWQVSKAIAVTPDLQYIKNPALNPEADSIWVFGLRVRGAL